MKRITPFILAVASIASVSTLAQADAPSKETRVVGIGSRIYNLPNAEADALEFIYSSMPMSDYLMYTPEFHLRNIRIAMKAREEMPWGKNIPEHIWKHFVLPGRSNNEYLDNFRTTYYDELKERVKGLDMEKAALEVNHWLHEKVTYEPSDARTSAPMATILNSKGRCGEESVLGVAAFRTVGIPARQVYTPRWAHTDDNHAWVEVWIDGKWYFLGACEPEPELNRAWFNAPASRGILMHTRVFGDYGGPEQIISTSKGITEINVTDNYVPVRESTVTVVNTYGKPVSGVTVEYKIYNYAEFFTAARMATDKNGKTMLRTGHGDMVAWATDGKQFGFAKVCGPETTLVLNHKIGDVFEIDLDLVPPTENPIPSHATAEEIKENAERFELENRLRNSYTDTFYGEKLCSLSGSRVHSQFGDDLTPVVETYLKKAKGNWNAIYEFLSTTSPDRLDEAIGLLSAISEKDLRDTPAGILKATLDNTPSDKNNPLYIQYILNPRVSNELLSDYRRAMRPGGKSVKNLSADKIIEDAKKIEIDNAANAYRVPITPTEVWKHRRADAHSRDIYFVAACRNNNIPARIDAVTGQCQYHDGANWVTVDFSGKTTTSTVVPEGRIAATFTPSGYLSDPEYYRHFTISGMNSGKPQLFEFGEDMGESYNSILKDSSLLPQGYYLLTTGVRQASGAVSAHLCFFNIEANKTTTIPLTMRHKPEAIEVIGNIDAEKRYLPHGATDEQSILSTTGRGYFIIGILGDTDEPSNHAATDLVSMKATLEKWGRPTLIIGKERTIMSELPNIHWGTDPDGKVRDMLLAAVGKKADTNMRLPIIVVADSFGRVVFYTDGYDTSLAQKLTNLLPQL